MTHIVVGLPVFNGEETINRCLDSILSQTYNNFKLIISDNSSTDSTSKICKEYEKKDKRVIYIRQKNNLGPIPNFRFVLNYLTSDYFVWLAHDDYWDEHFLENNVEILNSKKNVVASIGQTKYVGKKFETFDFNKNDDVLKNIYKKIRRHFLSNRCYSIYDSNYENRVKTCLKSRIYSLFFYSLFRTEILKKVFDHQTQSHDMILILKILRYGCIHASNDILIYRGSNGMSVRNNSIDLYRKKEIKFHKILFPRIAFLKWCKNNLSSKIILQNFGYFTCVSLSGIWGLFLSLVKYYKFRKYKQDYFFVKDLS